LDKVTTIVTHVDGTQVEWLIAVRPVRLRNDLVLLAIENEIAVALATKEELQCLGNIANSDAHRLAIATISIVNGLVEFEIETTVEKADWLPLSMNAGKTAFSRSKSGA
jgi:hypothetical protein